MIIGSHHRLLLSFNNDFTTPTANEKTPDSSNPQASNTKVSENNRPNNTEMDL